MEAAAFVVPALMSTAEAEGPPPFLVSTAVLVVAAAVIGYVSVRAKVVPIVGFLLAGVLIGPTQLGLVAEVETVEAAAEVGVIFLLFIIGIEFSLERLTAMRTWIVIGGLLQVGLAVGFVAALCLALGVGWRDAVFTGFLVSLSSTAVEPGSKGSAPASRRASTRTSARHAASRSPRLNPWPAIGCSPCAALPTTARREATCSSARVSASG